MSPTAANRVAEPGCTIRQMPPRAFDARPRAGVLIDIRERAEFGTGASAGATAIQRTGPAVPVALRALARGGTRDQPVQGRSRTTCTAKGAARAARNDGGRPTGGTSDWTVAVLRRTMR